MKEWLPPRFMANAGQLHMLYTCPFCWKVRGLLEHLDIPHERIQVNPMRTKKTLPSAPEWNKVPVWVDSNNDVHVDSTPIMKHIDTIHNGGKLWSSDDEERRGTLGAVRVLHLAAERLIFRRRSGLLWKSARRGRLRLRLLGRQRTGRAKVAPLKPNRPQMSAHFEPRPESAQFVSR